MAAIKLSVLADTFVAFISLKIPNLIIQRILNGKVSEKL